MPTDQSCANCAHMHPVSFSTTQAVCWRFPPVPIGQPFVNSLAIVPVVSLTNGSHCGEWKKAS